MSITAIVMLSAAVFLALFDVYVIAKKGKQESISAYVIRGSKKYPLLVLMFGILLGHLFWSMKTEDIYYGTKCFDVEADTVGK